jgi:class 3 adenylate cyclase
MKLSWNNIANIGVDETVEPSEVRHINLVNILAIFISLFELSYMTFFVPFFQQTKFLLLFGTAIGILNLGVVLLNYYKFHLIARVFFGLLGIIIITVNSPFLGRETLTHIFLLESIVIAFFIYPPKENVFRNAIIFLNAAAFIGLEVWFTHHAAIIENVPKLFIYSQISGLLVFMVAISFYIYTIIHHAEARLEEEQLKSERLLLNILPKPIAKRLKDGSGLIADHIEEATILFSDIVDFTKMSETMPANKVVSMLDEIFTEFDFIADKYGLEKIKTIGDAYMVVGGIPEPRVDHSEAIANMALAMQQLMNDKYFEKYQGLKLRVGIHIGPVVAGVIGRRKFSYDLWGDSVNTASRMESQGVEGKIQVTQKVYEKLKNHYYFEYRGDIEIKGKNMMAAYFLISRK